MKAKVVRRACDACFMQKEKCTHGSNHDVCDRCQRLARPCTRNRVVRSSGRRRLATQPVHRGPASQSQLQVQRPATLNHLRERSFQALQPVDEYVMCCIGDFSQFKDFATIPSVGPAQFQEALQCFWSRYDDLHDGIFAMYGAFAAARDMRIPKYDPEDNTKQGATALRRFRGMPSPTDRESFIPWLWLGISLMIHAHCAFGSAATPLRKYMLGHLEHLGEQGTKLRQHPTIVSTAAMDIYDSLVHQQLPAMNLPDAAVDDPNCFFSACAPLLKTAFELCKVSFSNALPIVDSEEHELPMSPAMDAIEASIRSWQPSLSPETLSTLSSAQTTIFLAHTHAHKTMLLLFIHRLRHTFGDEDALAAHLADSILSTLELTRAATGGRLPMCAVPFVLAAVEAKSIEEQNRVHGVLDVHLHSVSRVALAAIKDWLCALWQARDNVAGLRWLDRKDSLPSMCLFL